MKLRVETFFCYNYERKGNRKEVGGEEDGNDHYECKTMVLIQNT